MKPGSSKRVAGLVAGALVLALLVLALISAWWWAQRSGPDTRARVEARPAGTFERATRISAGASGQGPDDREPPSTTHAETAGPDQVVAGQVIDPDSGPLGEGRVDLACEDGQVTARLPLDEEGRFAGPGCAGQTCARLVHPAFEQPEPWLLEPGSLRELEVTRAQGISGRVVSTRKEPVPNASVLLWRADQRAAGVTDAGGEFAISLPSLRPCDACDAAGTRACRPPSDPSVGDTNAGRVTANLLVSADGYAPRDAEILLGTGEVVELVLAPPAKPITGRVLGADGRPFGPRTVVQAINVALEADQHAAEVRADGGFELGGLAEAAYRLRVVRDGVALVTRERVEAGTQLDLRAEVDARLVDLEIEVVDAEGRVGAGVRIDGGPLRSAVTDAGGHVRVEAVLPGAYTLRVRAPGCEVVPLVMEVDGRAATEQHTLRLIDCSLADL